MKLIKKLIINSPYHEPQYHWHYDRERRIFEKREGRRSAGYVTATPRSKTFDDPGVFVPIELVEKSAHGSKIGVKRIIPVSPESRAVYCAIGATLKNAKIANFSFANWKLSKP